MVFEVRAVSKIEEYVNKSAKINLQSTNSGRESKNLPPDVSKHSDTVAAAINEAPEISILLNTVKKNDEELTIEETIEIISMDEDSDTNAINLLGLEEKEAPPKSGKLLLVSKLSYPPRPQIALLEQPD